MKVRALQPLPPELRRQAPLYDLIADVLRTAVAHGSIPPGTVLLEGPVAGLLRATRTPVRQALQRLEEEGVVSRFEGRGYMAGSAALRPTRVPLTPQMLGISGEEAAIRKPLGWQTIHDEVERDVVHLAVFGFHRINELELARYFGVGRLVARDVLLRLESVGLIEKDERLRWLVMPLDSDRINQLYELRWLLEPAALGAAIGAGPIVDAHRLIDSLDAVGRSYPKIASSVLDQLETDLHIDTLAHCPNKALLQSLERTRCVLTLSKHVLGTTMPMPKSDPFMSEHRAILTAVRDQDAPLAQSLLRKHLEASCLKVMARAETLRRDFEAPRLPYVGGGTMDHSGSGSC